MQPKISVITISYNSEKTIEKTIQSVIQQDYENLEYIIIDGKSKDGTVDVIKKYEDKIAYWVSEKDNGISDAFNKGIAAATGEIIGIVNSDDQYLPGALKAIADCYDPKVDVYRGAILIHDDIKNIEYTYQPSMKFGMLPIKVNVCHLPTFITKKAYEKYGNYSTDFKLAMDLDLLRRFYRTGAKFKKVDKVLGRFNVGGVSTQAGIDRAFDERRKVILANGGNMVDVFIYNCLLNAIDVSKKLVNLGKIDYLKIRYCFGSEYEKNNNT